MRREVNEKTTLIKNATRDYTFENKDSIPTLEIAIGEIEKSTKGSVYQQLHDYPPQPKEIQIQRAKGTKPRILPTRREFLIGLQVMIAVRSNLLGLKERILNGLSGFNINRYGLPFAGDNNYFFDNIQIYESPNIISTWYYPVSTAEIPDTETVRLTVGINRINNSDTSSPLFALTKEKSLVPPENAWVWTPRI
jgi:CRISPR-associated protein Cas5t